MGNITYLAIFAVVLASSAQGAETNSHTAVAIRAESPTASRKDQRIAVITRDGNKIMVSSVDGELEIKTEAALLAFANARKIDLEKLSPPERIDFIHRYLDANPSLDSEILVSLLLQSNLYRGMAAQMLGMKSEDLASAKRLSERIARELNLGDKYLKPMTFSTQMESPVRGALSELAATP